MSTSGRTATPTLDDVARLAGVSRATASRVVRGSLGVSGPKAEKVEQAVAMLGYVPNIMARALATQHSGVVAVLVPESEDRVFNDPFFSQVYQGALQAFTGSSTRVVLSISQPDESPDAMARFLASGHVDGAIVASHHGRTTAQLLDATGQPVVFIGDPGLAGAHFVDLDQAHGVRLAVERLISRGARRIGTITGPLDMGAGVARRAAFRQVLAEHGMRPVCEKSGDFTAAGGRLAAQQIIAEGHQFDGLFIASDLMALGASGPLEAAGRRIGDDLLVVGFDDSQIARHMNPGLTTVTNPPAAMARRAGLMLQELMSGAEVSTPGPFKPELVLRQSA